MLGLFMSTGLVGRQCIFVICVNVRLCTRARSGFLRSVGRLPVPRDVGPASFCELTWSGVGGHSFFGVATLCAQLVVRRLGRRLTVGGG
jgi:hypothetical protein